MNQLYYIETNVFSFLLYVPWCLSKEDNTARVLSLFLHKKALSHVLSFPTLCQEQIFNKQFILDFN